MENLETNAEAIILTMKLMDPVKTTLNDCGVNPSSSNTKKNPANCLPDMLQAKQYFDKIKNSNQDIFAVSTSIIPLGQFLMKASVDCGN